MQQTSSRFHCPSITLDLKHLLSKNRRLFSLCLVMAVCVHLTATRWAGSQGEQKAVQPLTTRFVKRAPRLTKPLEMKKRPRPKRRPLQRKTISVKAKADWQGIGVVEAHAAALQSLARPQINVQRATGLGDVGLEPASLAAAIESQKEEADRIEMSLEMLDVQALDTGRYQAMVIQDPSDRRSIKGFFHFYRAYPNSAIQNPAGGGIRQVYLNEAIMGLSNLVDALNRYTDIRSDVKGSINFDSRELFETPWTYHLGVDDFKLTPSEAANIGQYMQIGGQLFADTIWRGSQAPGDHSNRDMIRDALDTVGMKYKRDWDFTKLPRDHTIYNCFFEFSGPPAGGMEPFRSMGGVYADAPFFDYLEGVIVGGRVMAIVSNKWYAKCWGAWGPGLYFPNQDNRRQLQFGVNIVVFALTQEGSITNRVMDAVQ